MPHTGNVKLRADITAHLLVDPLDKCLGLRKRYHDVPRRTFSRYLRDGRLALSAPGVSSKEATLPGSSQRQSENISTPLPTVPGSHGSGAYAVAMLRGVYFEAWDDAVLAQRLGRNFNGAVINAAWLDASIVARTRLLDVRFSREFGLLDRQEADIRAMLAAAHAESPQLGDLCERWIEEFAMARWARCCPAVETSRLHDLLRDAELTRPALMGGRGKAGSPAGFKRSVTFRTRWILAVTRLLREFWNPEGWTDLLSHMVDQLVALDGAGNHTFVVEWASAMRVWEETRIVDGSPSGQGLPPAAAG